MIKETEAGLSHFDKLMLRYDAWSFGNMSAGSSSGMNNLLSDWSFAGRSAQGTPFDMSYRGNRGVMGSKIAGWNARLSGSAMGRALRMGTMESFGWSFDGGVSQGFLGLGAESNNFRRSTSRYARMTGKSKFTSGIKVAGRMAKKGGIGLAGRTLVKSLGLISTAYFAYDGYQRDGVRGAIEGVGESIAYSAAASFLIGGAGTTIMSYAAAPLGIAAIGYGTYMLGEAGIAHAKGLRDLEMGGGDLMQQTITSASTATARQRSLLALNNTHINGRMSLGNEGFLMHRGFSA